MVLPYHFTHDQIFTVFGNLRIEQSATFIYGGMTPVKRQRMIVKGNITLLTGGTLKVNDWTGIETASNIAGPFGTAGYDYYEARAHGIYLYGNLRNQGGTVRLTSDETLNLSGSSNRSRAALFLLGDKDMEIWASGTTDLHYLIVDKEHGLQNRVTVYAEERTHFRLFGSNIESSQLGLSPDNPIQRKALWIKSGEFVLRKNTVIATLSEGGDPFIIPSRGALVLDGDNVVFVGKSLSAAQVQSVWGIGTVTGVGTSQNNQTLAVSGKLHVARGVLSVGEGEGPLPRGGVAGNIEVSASGVLMARQIYSDATAGTLRYEQSGGLTLLRGSYKDAQAINYDRIRDANRYFAHGTGGINSAKATFSLMEPGDAFILLGGEIRILAHAEMSDLENPLLAINCPPENYYVTGGTLTFDKGDAKKMRYSIQSTAPFEHVRIIKGSQKDVEVKDNLTVLSDLTSEQGTLLLNGALTVGRHLTITGPSATLKDAPGATRVTLTLNGEEDGILSIDNSAPLSLSEFTVRKSPGKSVTVSKYTGAINVSDLVEVAEGSTFNLLGYYASNKLLLNGADLIISGRIARGEVSMRAGASIHGLGEGYIEFLSFAGSSGEWVDLRARRLSIGQLLNLGAVSFDLGLNGLHLAEGASFLRQGQAMIAMASEYGAAGITKTFGPSEPSSFVFPIRRPRGVTADFDRSVTLSGNLWCKGIFQINYVDDFHPRINKNKISLVDDGLISDKCFWRVRTGDSPAWKEVRFEVKTSGEEDHRYKYLRFWDGDKFNPGFLMSVAPAEYGPKNHIILDANPTGDHARGRRVGTENQTFFYQTSRTGNWYHWMDAAAVGNDGRNDSIWATNWTGGDAYPSYADRVIINSGHTVTLTNIELPGKWHCYELDVKEGAVLDVKDVWMYDLYALWPNKGKIRDSTTYNFGRVKGGGLLKLLHVMIRIPLFVSPVVTLASFLQMVGRCIFIPAPMTQQAK